MSITGENIVLSFLYLTSSLKIELSVMAGELQMAMVSAATKKSSTGEWNNVHIPLSSDVEAVRLVAKKRVVTTAVEYVLVKSLKLEAITIPPGTVSLSLHGGVLLRTHY